MQSYNSDSEDSSEESDDSGSEPTTGLREQARHQGWGQGQREAGGEEEEEDLLAEFETDKGERAVTFPASTPPPYFFTFIKPTFIVCLFHPLAHDTHSTYMHPLRLTHDCHTHRTLHTLHLANVFRGTEALAVTSRARLSRHLPFTFSLACRLALSRGRTMALLLSDRLLHDADPVHHQLP